MSTAKEKLSCKQFLKTNAGNFKLAEFYDYFNFETRPIAENALKGTIFTLKKTAKKNKKNLNSLLEILSSNNYEYFKNPAVEVYWSRIEARNAQIERIHTQARVQAVSEISIIEDIKESPSSTKRTYVVDVTVASSNKRSKTN